MTLLLIILVLLFVFGGGYWGGNRYNEGYGPHFGLGAVLVVVLIIWLLGGFGSLHGLGRW